ncbi:hypothetical protein QE370_002895 [Aeromicrobium sp. SORGH_AS981]|uniref:3'-5' exonuclease n=1 Tax=Aeromicrobium sp. SORGH_AS_0981 TaxID=3041802 RepID=UPI0028578F23|nr:3'-5' exonuclease [Aeromicrobium sp. SORGH_AS_0981]MDR6119711.1 hypothetical protein [Aeromicrobium sp. SORGH_AS_0981]
MPHIIYSQGMPKLDGGLKQAAWSFFEKLSENDASPGLHIEPINGVVDERVRTGRVNQNFRAVLFKLVHDGDTTYVLHGIWPHDDAIEKAKKSRLTVNPVNGVAEVSEATVSAVPVAHAPKHGDDKAALGYFESVGFVLQDLTEGLGIAEDVARRALKAPSEDDLLEVAAGAVQWQGVALLELASGKSIDSVREILGLDVQEPSRSAEEPTDEEIVKALDHPAAKLQFAWIEDDEDLRRVVEEGDFAAWRTFLHPEQRRYAEMSTNGPFRLSGGAGTGKTVVLLHRARQLHLKDPQARVVLTTYSRTLAESLVQNLRLLDSSLTMAPNLGDPGVHVVGVDQLSVAAMKRAGSGADRAAAIEATVGARAVDPGTIAPNDAWQQVAAGASADVAPELLAPSFLEAEYAMVVLPQRITTREQYFKARRPGRGVALDRGRRAQVWDLVEAYRAAGAVGRWLDFNERAAVAAEVLERTGAVADHLLVDEGQDLTPSKWQMLRAAAAPGSDDLFIAEDSHQRIFGQRVVLGRLGIKIVGRSRSLTLNYRTTAQNLGYALGVLTGETYVDGEGEQDTSDHYRSSRSGPAPLVVQAESAGVELDDVAEIVRGWIQDERAPESIGILVRTNKEMKRIAGALDERGVPARQVTGHGGSAKGQVQVMTMTRSKGMEFECVLIAGVGQDDMPASWLMKNLAEADQADFMQRERSLLYVSATRARDELAVVWSGKPSPILPGGDDA